MESRRWILGGQWGLLIRDMEDRVISYVMNYVFYPKEDTMKISCNKCVYYVLFIIQTLKHWYLSDLNRDRFSFASLLKILYTWCELIKKGENELYVPHYFWTNHIGNWVGIRLTNLCI